MGNCARKHRYNQVHPKALPEPDCDYYIDLVYPQIGSLLIQSTPSNKHPPPLEFGLTLPIQNQSHLISIPEYQLWTSHCTLPGADPLKSSIPECQDTCFIVSDGLSLLACVMDGHGPNGKEIVTFCAEKAQDIYSSAHRTYVPDPITFLEELIKKVDSETKSHNNGIRTASSGW
jgi:hypothetical protein